MKSFYSFSMDCAEELVRHEAYEKWGALAQGHAQGVVINSLYTYVFRLHRHKLFALYGGFKFRILCQSFGATCLVSGQSYARRRMNVFVKGSVLRRRFRGERGTARSRNRLIV